MSQYPSTTLFFIRHGQARSPDGTYNDQTPLSKLGHEQASMLHAAFVDMPAPAAVYSSPFPRAKDTAAPLGEALNLPIQIDTRLSEYPMPDQPLEAAEQRSDLVLWKPEHCGIDESLETFSVRIGSCCEDLVNQHLENYIILVAHAGTIDAAIRWALNIDPKAPWMYDFGIYNASITEVEIWPQGRVPNGAPRYAEFKRIGDTSHLKNLVTGI